MNSNGLSPQSRLMNWRNILLFIFGFIIVYLVWSYVFASGSVKLSNMKSALEATTVNSSDLPINSYYIYTVSVWVFVKEWNTNFGKEKVILQRSSSTANPSAVNPKLAFDSNTNNLVVTISKPGAKAGEFSDFRCDVPNIPLQTWVNIIVAVNNRTIDVYFNGKLVKTCMMDNVPIDMPNAPITITPNGGFSGFTSDVKYFNTALNPQEAYDLYSEGFSGSSLLGSLVNKFKLRFSILKNEQVVNTYDF